MVIDEIQRAPDLLSYIQVLVDEDRRAGRFIVTGSHNLLLMKSVAQTLAGRTAVLTLHPLSLAELRGKENIDAANLDRIDATGWAATERESLGDPRHRILSVHPRPAGRCRQLAGRLLPDLRGTRPARGGARIGPAHVPELRPPSGRPHRDRS